MHASARCRIFIRSKETLRLSVYDDGGGTPTQGFGHTGPDVVFGGPDIDHAKAEQWFSEDIAKAEKEVHRCVTVPITQGMFDCLVSFEFNCGGIEIRFNRRPQPSRMLIALNERRYNDAAEELVKWNMDGGKDRRGLLTRRCEECLFYTSEKYPT